KQEIKDTKIKLDYYENTREGFVIKKEFSQEIPFAEKIEFEVLAGFIAKLSLETKVDKKNTSIEKYSLNNRKVKNPRYTGINKKEDKDDDEEGSQKEEVKPTEEKKEEKDADTQIVATDSNGNEIQVVEKDNSKEETIEETTPEKDTSQISALILN